MRLNLKRTYAANFNSSLEVSQGGILLPVSICESFKMNQVTCSSAAVTSQVYIYSFKLKFLKNYSF